MDIYIIIPAHNEAAFVGKCLKSIVSQSLLPRKVIVVDDHSIDNTTSETAVYTQQYPFISLIYNQSDDTHLPGSKVINAFYKGLSSLDDNFDILIKLDADIVLPSNYLEKIIALFHKYPKAGIAGGYAYEQNNNGIWLKNHPMDALHVRGAFKAYRKNCFEKIGGLRRAMGWDTVDELLAKYYGYTIVTDETLEVKHLRPVTKDYNPAAKRLQGSALYAMGYDWILAIAAALKISYKHQKIQLFTNTLLGYRDAKKQRIPKMVNSNQAKYIRRYRYKNIRKKLLR